MDENKILPFGNQQPILTSAMTILCSITGKLQKFVHLTTGKCSSQKIQGT